MASNGHSRLPPSSALRWTECSASVSFIEANASCLSFESSPEADEGTRAHALLTAILTHTLGQVADNEEMRAAIDELVVYIKSLMKPGDRLLVDQKVPLFYLPSQRGTLDVAIVGKDRIVVLDLKYGKGVGVYAEKNKQLAIYAESQIQVLEQLEAFAPETPVELVIYQPRDRNDPVVVRPWLLTRGELAKFCEHIQQAKDDIYAGRVKFMPGKACDFCPATGICTAYGSQGLSAISDGPVDAAIEALPRTMIAPALTREQRQRVLTSKKDLIAWLEAIENQEVAELMAGAAPMQFKLVEGKSNRQWKDEKAAAAYLAQKGVPIDGIYPPKPLEICSPAQGEKALKSAGVKLTDEVKAEIKQRTEKPQGKATLVPVTDERPAMNFNPTQGLSVVADSYDGI
jgi:hypothetical protein